MAGTAAGTRGLGGVPDLPGNGVLGRAWDGYHAIPYIRLNSTPSQRYLHDKLAALEGGHGLGPARVAALRAGPPRRGRGSLPMLMARSRHKKPENVRRYFHPSAEAIAEVTSLLAPGGSRR